MTGMYGNRKRVFDLGAGSSARQAPGSIVGRVLETIDYEAMRCDVQLMTGEILRNVAYPGPRISVVGIAHGPVRHPRKNQAALVEFQLGSGQNPIIAQFYSFFLVEKEVEARKTWQAQVSANYQPEAGDEGDFHEGGHYVVRKAAQTIFYGPDHTPALTIDYASKTLVVGPGWKMTATAIYAPGGVSTSTAEQTPVPGKVTGDVVEAKTSATAPTVNGTTVNATDVNATAAVNTATLVATGNVSGNDVNAANNVNAVNTVDGGTAVSVGGVPLNVP